MNLPEPYFETDLGVLHVGHVLDVLRGMPEESVQCCVTSPPYWGLRDYGLEPQVWEDPGADHCEHEWKAFGPPHHPGQVPDQKWKTNPALAKGQTAGSGQFCSLCGAWRGSLGLEPTPGLFISHMVQVFREVRRVLRQDGTVWLNLGDSYAGNGLRGGGDPTIGKRNLGGGGYVPKPGVPPGLKPKDLVGIPWRVAFALQADGWWLRQDIIWDKPNPMPESVKDRPTRAHEYLFLLAKSERYYFGQDEVREETADYTRKGGSAPYLANGSATHGIGSFSLHQMAPKGRNLRSVWTIPTQPFPEAHFATFPPKLVEPCVKAGAPMGAVVLDPFMGAGTVALVCENLNRRWAGIELNPEYAEIARKRLWPIAAQGKLFRPKAEPMEQGGLLPETS